MVSGKIRRTFRNPNNQKFLQCSVDDQMEQLVALDENGSCFVWKLSNKQASTLDQTCLRQRTTSKLKPGSAMQRQTVVDAASPIYHLEKQILVDGVSDHESIHMLLDKNIMVLAMKNNPVAYRINVSDGNQTEEITGIYGPFKFALKVKEDALLVSNTECALVSIAKRSLERVTELKEILGSNANHLSDVIYASEAGLVLFVAGDNLVFWNPAVQNKSTLSCIQLRGMNETSPKAILPSLTSLCIVIDKEVKQYCRIDLIDRGMIDLREISKKNQPVQHVTLTPDGQYMLYVCNDKDLCLLRLSDGKLIAWYTMYDTVQKLSVSANSWYALIGTSDRRLFVLVIADPLERSHDKRIEHVRKANPPLTQEQIATLLGDINKFDYDSDQSFSDSSVDDYFLEKATQRLQQKNNASKANLKVLYSSDSSGEDEEEAAAMMKCKPQSKGNEKYLAPSASSKGQLFTLSPCSLQ